MTTSDINLEEALREIAILEKQLEDRLKKREKPPGPPSPIITTTKSSLLRGAPCTRLPKLQSLEPSHFSLPQDLISFVRGQTHLKLKSIVPHLRSLPHNEFLLPKEYFPEEEEQLLSPSLLRRKRRSPVLSGYSSAPKRSRVLRRSVRLRKCSVELLEGENEVISECCRVERGSDESLAVAFGDGESSTLLEALVPFVAKRGSSHCVFLACYGWHESSGWRTNVRLLLKESRPIESLQLHRTDPSGTLYVLYVIPSLSVSRIHSFRPLAGSYTSSLSHKMFPSVKAKVQRSTLVTSTTQNGAQKEQQGSNTFFLNVQNGRLTKRIHQQLCRDLI